MYSWAKVTSRSCCGDGAGELARVVVVVEHEVAVQVARQAPLRRLAAVGCGVAEEGPADLVEVDVGLALPATLAPVGLRRAPAELAVLDRVDVLGDRLDANDVVGDPVGVGVGQLRGVDPLRHPVNAEVASAGGRARRLGDRVGVAVGVGMVGRARRGGAEHPLVRRRGREAGRSSAADASDAPISRQRARIYFLRLLTRAYEMFLHCCIRVLHRLNRCQ